MTILRGAVVLHAILFPVIIRAEAAVVVQRFAVDRHALGPRLGYRVYPLLGGDVDEIYR